MRDEFQLARTAVVKKPAAPPRPDFRVESFKLDPRVLAELHRICQGNFHGVTYVSPRTVIIWD